MSQGFCGVTSRTAPSREWTPYIYDNIDDKGTVVAEADPERQSCAIVSRVAAGGIDLWVVEALAGSNPKSTRIWPLTPGEGVVINSAALIAVKSSVAGTPVAVKVLIERGAVG
jgi:hypothetical protein